LTASIQGETILLPNDARVDISVFCDIFANVVATYTELMTVDNGEKGYKLFFDHYKENGSLPD